MSRSGAARDTAATRVSFKTIAAIRSATDSISR